MSLLPPGYFAVLRARVGLSFPATCDIVRGTRTDTDEGGWTNAETVVAAAVPCSYAPIGTGGGSERIIAERMAAVADTVINVPEGTTVTERDRVVIGTRTFEVKNVGDDRSELTHLRIYAQEIT